MTDHRAEAERLAGLVQQRIDAKAVEVPIAEAISLGTLHALLHLADVLEVPSGFIAPTGTSEAMAGILAAADRTRARIPDWRPPDDGTTLLSKIVGIHAGWVTSHVREISAGRESRWVMSRFWYDEIRNETYNEATQQQIIDAHQKAMISEGMSFPAACPACENGPYPDRAALMEHMAHPVRREPDDADRLFALPIRIDDDDQHAEPTQDPRGFPHLEFIGD